MADCTIDKADGNRHWDLLTRRRQAGYAVVKDSGVIKRLAEMAGVKFQAHYSCTSVDPPELVRFIKAQKDVYFDIPRYADGKPITMWNLMPKKKMPPTAALVLFK